MVALTGEPSVVVVVVLTRVERTRAGCLPDGPICN